MADILSGSIFEGRAGEALYVLKEFVREEVKKESAERVEIHVAKKMAEEMKQVATKGDLHEVKADLKEDIRDLRSTIRYNFYWMLAGFGTVLASIIVTLVAIVTK